MIPLLLALLFQTHLDVSQINSKGHTSISLVQAAQLAPLAPAQLPAGCQTGVDSAVNAAFMACVPVPRPMVLTETATGYFAISPPPPGPQGPLKGNSFNSELNLGKWTGKLDVFTFPAASYQLAFAPASGSPILVTLNGLTLCAPCGTDYTLSVSGVLTIPNSANMSQLTIQVWYWVT